MTSQEINSYLKQHLVNAKAKVFTTTKTLAEANKSKVMTEKLLEQSTNNVIALQEELSSAEQEVEEVERMLEEAKKKIVIDDSEEEKEKEEDNDGQKLERRSRSDSSSSPSSRANKQQPTKNAPNKRGQKKRGTDEVTSLSTKSAKKPAPHKKMKRTVNDDSGILNQIIDEIKQKHHAKFSLLGGHEDERRLLHDEDRLEELAGWKYHSKQRKNTYCFKHYFSPKLKCRFERSEDAKLFAKFMKEGDDKQLRAIMKGKNTESLSKDEKDELKAIMLYCKEKSKRLRAKRRKNGRKK